MNVQISDDGAGPEQENNAELLAEIFSYIARMTDDQLKEVLAVMGLTLVACTSNNDDYYN